MIVYFEEVFFQNFILDGLLLFLTLKTTKIKVRFPRLLLGATLGGAYAVFLPMLVPQPFLALITLLFGFFLLLLSVKIKGKKLLFVTVVFYLYAFLLAGVLFGVAGAFNLIDAKNGCLILPFPFFSILGIALTSGGVLFFMVKWLYRWVDRVKNEYACQIVTDRGSFSCKGLLDTGNRLTFDGLPVNFLDGRVKSGLFSDGERVGKMEIHTVAGNAKVNVFQARLKIYSDGEWNIIDKAYFALNAKAEDGECKLIIPPSILEGK